MRQRIEKQQEAKTFGSAITVMCNDRMRFSGVKGALFARGNAPRSLSVDVALSIRRPFYASALSGWVDALPERRRARNPSLSWTEEFSAKGPTARSAAVFVTYANTPSPKSVATAMISLNEQRSRAVPVMQQLVEQRVAMRDDVTPALAGGTLASWACADCVGVCGVRRSAARDSGEARQRRLRSRGSTGRHRSSGSPTEPSQSQRRMPPGMLR